MKLISLNTWGGKLENALAAFLVAHRDETDVFCFQEVFNAAYPAKSEKHGLLHTYTMLSGLLSGHTGMYAPSYDVTEADATVPYGLAMFVRKDIGIRAYGAYEFFQRTDDLGLPEGIAPWNRMLQYVTISKEGSRVSIFNFHGLYTGGGKGDNDARIAQSQKVKMFMARQEGHHILCGDFNLDPATKSMCILEEGMRNLINERSIASTRSSHYHGENKFADFVLVDHGISVVDFKVMQNEVSDHLPLLLEWH